MMLRMRPLVLSIVLSSGIALSQSVTGSSPQGTSSNVTVDCTDPLMAADPECTLLQQGAGAGQRGQASPSSGVGSVDQVPQLRNPLSPYESQYPARAVVPLNPSQIRKATTPTWPQSEFEQMAADSAGRPLPLFGQSLFDLVPSTFAPIEVQQIPSDYVIGPGDELQIRVWGQLQADLRVIVDRSGQIYVPRVGEISVTGVHYSELEQVLKNDISRVFKNFNLNVNVGRLRSIQVLVVGNARFPGTYTISSLSTLVNAIFASGGPLPEGSLRHIQVRRDGKTVTDFDFYELLIRGDKSKDVRLQSGDVLYMPPVGPLIAISGSVNTPAIYELRDDSTLKDLIEYAGGFSSLADTGKITIERVEEHQARKTLEFPYDDVSRMQPVRDGDVVRVLSIVPSFQDTVTLRGNVANPGRYPWKPGMRIRDLIPSPESLLTRRYWLDRADIGNGHNTEYPVRPGFNVLCLPTPIEKQQTGSANQEATQTTAVTPGALSPTVPPVAASTPAPAEQQNVIYIPCDSGDREATGEGSRASEHTPLGSQKIPDTEYGSTRVRTATNVTADLRRYAPEINWDYAIVQRVNPADLTSKLLWFSPRSAILKHEENSNLELQPGDIVTIFSQRDIRLPEDARSRYVVIEGEVERPGVYKLEENETLHSVLQRAGGLTPNAYVYGSQLLRESARIEQQNSLDQLVNEMEVQIRQSALAIAASASGGDAQGISQLEQGIISQLHGARATGRVALPVKPSDKKLTDFPDMLLEDNDRLIIPHSHSTISVVGNVYNPGSFIYDPRTTSGAYLVMAGKGKPHSDLHHAFVLRANGVVVAANNINGPFVGTKFERLRLYPGDEIIVPYKIPTGAFVRGLRDWSQIGSQLAITAAALAVVAP